MANRKLTKTEKTIISETLEKYMDTAISTNFSVLDEQMFSREDVEIQQNGDYELFRQTKNYISKMTSFPNFVIVVGCGGIGSWASLFLSGIRRVTSICLIDSDIVEPTNIGRTPFMIHQIGVHKTEALQEIIALKNPFVDVHCVNARVGTRGSVEHKGTKLPLQEILNNIDTTVSRRHPCRRNDLPIIDCRDNNSVSLKKEFDNIFKNTRRVPIIYRAAYNGSSVTIDPRVESRDVFGENGYTQVNSSVFPSVLSAWMILQEIADQSCKFYSDVVADKKLELTLESFKDAVADIPLTFNAGEATTYIKLGVTIAKLLDLGCQSQNNKTEISELATSIREFITNKKQLTDLHTKTADNLY